MVQKMTVALCYEPPLTEHGADLQDISEQAAFVRKYLSSAGYTTYDIVYGGDPISFLQKIKEARPQFIWNLFETFGGVEQRQNLGAALLEITGIPYTGSKLDAITHCSDKRTVKAILYAAGIPVPETRHIFTPGRWILKPAKLHGSAGITEKSVVYAASEEDLLQELKKYPDSLGIFAERYIDGREFSVTMLDFGDRLSAVAIAEMLFSGYRSGESKILTFNAKWAEESAEYKNSVRTFNFTTKDTQVLEEMKTVAEKTAVILGLSGFARIDFRLSADNKIWVIDVNPNPCLGEDSGFTAACGHAGVNPEQMVSYIIKAASATY